MSTTPNSTPEAIAIAVIFEDFAIDHTPDGWPAIKQMHLSAAATELRKQHADIERLTAEIEKQRTARIEAQVDNEALKAKLARSGLERHKAVRDAVTAEREVCAVFVKSLNTAMTDNLADAIRTRGAA